MMGGMAPIADRSMEMGQKDSLNQGSQYLSIHKGQYGGGFGKYPEAFTQKSLTQGGGGMGSYPGAVIQGNLVSTNAQKGGYGPYPASVESNTLPSDMIASSRTGPLDVALSQIKGMQDGGRRRHKRRNTVHRGGACSLMRGGRRSRKHRRNRSQRRRVYRHSGGSHNMSPAPVDAKSMLLPPGLEKSAALNYEWSMAKDPSSFAPQ
jgi:hypothetical protein